MSKWLKAFAFSSLVAFSSLSAGNDYMIDAEEAIKLIGKPGVVFVNGDNPDAFALGHIKGSVNMEAHHIHHADIVGHLHCAPLFMCPDEAENYIADHGISNDTFVIAYDNYMGPNATGVWAYFKSYGHNNVKVLNGGVAQIKMLDENQKKYDAIKDEEKANKKLLKDAKKALKDDKSDANKKLVDELKAKEKAYKAQLKEIEETLLIQKGKVEHSEHKGHYSIDVNKINYDVIAGKEEMVKAMEDIEANGKNSKYRILDSRRFAEIIGEGKLDRVARGGHVPGSTFLEWKHISDSVNKLSYKPLDEIQKIFDQYGIKKDHIIYTYCHVGAGRSTHLSVALEQLGYKNVKVYTGSWDEWGNDMNLPNRR
jgi:thiosulfate/3-mercaptopyruvate sulfurtransferase